MREIKFRVWDKVIKVMREVLSIDFEKQEVICPPRGHEFSEWYNQHLSFNEVFILQNTGLKDKNGKEIYEGDVFHLGDPNIKYVVVWSDSGLRGLQLGTYGSVVGLEHWRDRIKLLGNKFEDPYLVGETKHWREKNDCERNIQRQAN